MQEDVATETSADISAGRQTIWQRLTGSGGASRAPMARKIILSLVVVAILVVGISYLYTMVPAEETPGVALDFPEEWAFGRELANGIGGVVDWMVVTWDPFFSAVNIVVLRILLPFEDFLQWLPWWLVIAGVGLLAWRAVGLVLTVVGVVFFGVIAGLGLFDLAMSTLAIVLTAALLCVVLGIPLGITAAKSDRFDGFLRPMLDGMQTMPSFVYLIPAIMLFGLGRTPAVMATTLYAIPPIIRFTNLGIRQVDTSVVEAGQSFGATPWQLLRKVQVPLALPTILAGLNQTVMMALAMVVIASMIGTKTLGTEVLLGIARLDVGKGILGGLSIVFMAIILDRISQGFARRPEAQPST